MRVLLVEDGRRIAEFVRQGLSEEGHAVDVAPDGEEALVAVAAALLFAWRDTTPEPAKASGPGMSLWREKP